jgi:hypothetical protein
MDTLLPVNEYSQHLRETVVEIQVCSEGGKRVERGWKEGGKRVERGRISVGGGKEGE